MNSVIVECFFVEATEDVALYKKLGADALGKAIAEGIANKKVPNPIASLIRVFKDDKQIGAFSYMDNAIKAAEQAMNEGARIVRIEKI